MGQPVTQYIFGPFRLDPESRVLLRGNQYVPLTPKAVQLLVLLVENSGRVLEKEELLRKVWPDTFVEDASVAKNISTLRKALGESKESRYIETVPKRGYRFVADVRVVDAAAKLTGDYSGGGPNGSGHGKNEQGVFRLSSDLPGRKSVLTRLGLALLAVASLGVPLLWIGFRDRSETEPDYQWQTKPLTSYPGRQNQAAISPDGARIAFVWEAPQDRFTHIYVKPVDSESLLQLTRGQASESKPAWSPDGRYIAFLREDAEERAWYLAPAGGGTPRKLATVNHYLVEPGSGNNSYFAPDGRSLAVVDRQSPDMPAAIFRLDLASGAKSRMTDPPPGILGDFYPAFSPDGTQLAFVRAISYTAADIYLLRFSDGSVRQVTRDGLTVEGLTWTRNGKELIFASRRGGSVNSLWRVAADGGAPRQVLVPGVETISPAATYSGERLVYTRILDDLNIWRYQFDESGRTRSRQPLIHSTFRDSDPDLSPDGQKIVFVSGRSGGFGIWVCQSDGSNARLLFDGGQYVTGSPRWSPDGRLIAFDSRSYDHWNLGTPNVWLISSGGGKPRRLTEDPAGGWAPSWSRDGRWIYYTSARTGRPEIWKLPPEGGNPLQVTHNGGFEAFESPDGRYLYFVKERAVAGIWKVPVGGGKETLVTAAEQAGVWRSWRPVREGIFFATAAAPQGPRVVFFDFGVHRSRELLRLPFAPDKSIPSLSASPDGRVLLVSQYDQSGSNIMLMERQP